MRQIYIVGPSGSGKTTLCRRFSEITQQFVHVLFDKDIMLFWADVMPNSLITLEDRGQELWNFAQKVLNNLQGITLDEITLLIDLDSEALYTLECQAFLLAHREVVICVTAHPNITYERQSKRRSENDYPPISKEEFIALEYSPVIQHIYESAAIMLDNSRDSVETSLKNFQEAVQSCIALP